MSKRTGQRVIYIYLAWSVYMKSNGVFGAFDKIELDISTRFYSWIRLNCNQYYHVFSIILNWIKIIFRKFQINNKYIKKLNIVHIINFSFIFNFKINKKNIFCQAGSPIFSWDKFISSFFLVLYIVIYEITRWTQNELISPSKYNRNIRLD